jgi:nucleotide-binding universal stress UspA family protein
MKVLLAVDESECSEAAVRALVTRFQPERTQVLVLHAVEWLKEMPLSFEFGQGPTYAQDIVESRSNSFRSADQLVTRIAGQLRLAGFQATVSIPDADPRHAIIDAARDWHADLILMGSHGRRGLDRVFMGSVAEAVVRHAPCSVEVERAPLFSRTPKQPGYDESVSVRG